MSCAVLVRNVIELLYNPQVMVRGYGIRIIKAHLGKDYGFRAKGKEKGRTKAVQALNKALKAKPELLSGTTAPASRKK